MKKTFNVVFGSCILIDVPVEAETKEEAVDIASKRLTPEYLDGIILNNEWVFSLEDIYELTPEDIRKLIETGS